VGKVAETTYLMKRNELKKLDDEHIEYYFYDAESFLHNDEIAFPIEVYFDDTVDENRALSLLNRL
jgi:hypothetical protein